MMILYDIRIYNDEGTHIGHADPSMIAYKRT